MTNISTGRQDIPRMKGGKRESPRSNKMSSLKRLKNQLTRNIPSLSLVEEGRNPMGRSLRRESQLRSQQSHGDCGLDAKATSRLARCSLSLHQWREWKIEMRPSYVCPC